MNKQREQLTAQGNTGDLFSDPVGLLTQTLSNPGAHLDGLLLIGGLVALALFILGRLGAAGLQNMNAAKPMYGTGTGGGGMVIAAGTSTAIFAAYFTSAQAFIAPFIQEFLQAVATVIGG